MLTPGYVGTVVFFHQVHIAEIKGWSLVAMAPAYPAWALSEVAAAFAAGWVADRFGPARLLPLAALPMGLGDRADRHGRDAASLDRRHRR